MLLRTLFSLLLLTNFYQISYSQIQLSPIWGLAYCRVKQVTSDPYIATHGIKDDFIGFEIQKNLGNNRTLIFPFYEMPIWLGATYKQLIYKKPLFDPIIKDKFYIKTKESLILEYIGTSMLSTGMLYESAFFRTRNKRSLFICPSAGATINFVVPTCWGDCGPSSEDTSAGNPSGPYLSFSSSAFEQANGNGDIVRNMFSTNINLGLKFQFHNKLGKNALFFKVTYSQGLVPILESKFQRTFLNILDDTEVTGKSTYRSYGTYWSFFVSYPITILNKKGERYRDRNPKE